ncbi:MAG: Sec-independent protein translocase protein TatB [Nitrospiraceae bacterium]|nr:Sec-independent protein translocase protein TatB [Nitrospiraceae bacterium]
MFDIGFQELIIIFVVALLVFGPEKLPEISRTLGRWVVQIRRGINDAKTQMESEFRELDPKVEDEVSKLVERVGDAETKTPAGDEAPEKKGGA